MKPRIVSFTVNGEAREITVAPNRSLLDALRTEAGLTGSKKGCDVGECGSCTVIMDGRPVNACLVLALEADGAEITTVEGLQASDGAPHRLQECFMQCGAAQCGFCTPGILVAAKALLDENPAPTVDEIRFAIAGNICRCTGYTKIIDAIALAAPGASGASGARVTRDDEGQRKEAAR
jgi:carbon-monoxide dehydrogenase small subunit